MLDEVKNPVGMPRGHIQYPTIMQLIEESLTTEPQTVNQVVEKIKLKQDQYPRTPNRDTVKHYLDALALDREKKVEKRIIGARMLTYRKII